jgi:hypothetical protein
VDDEELYGLLTSFEIGSYIFGQEKREGILILDFLQQFAK